jgi:hypothetical protein
MFAEMPFNFQKRVGPTCELVSLSEIPTRRDLERGLGLGSRSSGVGGLTAVVAPSAVPGTSGSHRERCRSGLTGRSRNALPFPSGLC